MKKRTSLWVGAAAVVTAAGLYTDAPETTGHTDGGLKAAALPKTSECVGTQPPGAATDADDTPLYRTLDHIDRLAAKRYADAYTGLSADQHDNAADLHRIPSADFDDAVCAAAEKGVTVRLHDTGVNRKDLDRLADRISEDMNRWDGTFQLREVGVDEQGWVYVGVDDPDTAEPILHRAFGGDHEEHIRVGHAEPVHAN